jgi:hypothetical protein
MGESSGSVDRPCLQMQHNVQTLHRETRVTRHPQQPPVTPKACDPSPQPHNHHQRKISAAMHELGSWARKARR